MTGKAAAKLVLNVVISAPYCHSPFHLSPRQRLGNAAYSPTRGV